MSTHVRVLVWVAITLVAARNTGAQPVAGSQLDPEQNSCATCHGESDLWEGDQRRLFISPESLAEDVHLLKGVNCHDCHGGDPTSFEVPEAHATEASEDQPELVSFRYPLAQVDKACGQCHEGQRLGMQSGVHRRGADKDETGRRGPLACGRCHGGEIHGMVAVRDRRSPVFLDNQVNVCGDCHAEALQTYKTGVHGQGLYQSGLLATATCADCHGAHAVYRASDERSTLYVTRVATTCAKCHRFLEKQLEQSVHGRGSGPGGETENAAPGGEVKRKPTCTDCHQGHDSGSPHSTQFRLGLPSRCGSCHVDLSSGYAISMHGSLSELGYGPAAECSDCHGGHDILPIDDPDSKLSATHRAATCKKCHTHATPNFLNYDPHANHRDFSRNPLEFCVYAVLMTFLISTFSFFGLHSVLWFLRGMVDVAKNGRAQRLVPGAKAYVRFSRPHRLAHAVMATSFLGLAATGLPLKYSHFEWSQTLARAFGGFELTSLWHRVFGVANMSVLAAYLAWSFLRLVAARKKGVFQTSLIFGPDSPVPTLRDVKDCLKMLRWFFGLGPKPTVERWSYWEKYDFWGATADILVIGFTGLILWFPNVFCAWLPGQVLNIAKVIHSTQALLATGFVFAIHFFNTHLRPEKFPMDMSVLAGLVSEKELLEERPEYAERMRRLGKLQELETVVPPRRVLWQVALAGAVALTIGLGLLVGIFLAISGE